MSNVSEKVVALRDKVIAHIASKAKIGPDDHASVDAAVMWYAAYMLAEMFEDSTKDLARMFNGRKLGIETIEDARLEIESQIEGACVTTISGELEWFDEGEIDIMFHVTEFWK